MKRIGTAIVLIAVLAACSGDRATVIPDAPMCRECRITSRTLLRLGALDGPSAFEDQPVRILRDGRGRYWVNARRIPQIFDSDGRFIRASGRPGSGPGEIAGAAIPIVVAGDSVVMVDDGSQRAIVFNSELRPSRSLAMVPGLFVGQIVRWPDAVFMNGMIRARDRFGPPLHIIAMENENAWVIRSGGHENQEFNELLINCIAVRDGELWTVDQTHYRITQWTEELEPVRTLHRRPRWWQRRSESVLGTRDTPPEPLVTSANFDERGFLWIVIHVPKRNWRDAWAKIPENATEISASQLQPSSLFDTLVEVIDLEAARIVNSVVFERYAIRGALPGGQVAFLADTPEGVPQLEIVSLAVERRR